MLSRVAERLYWAARYMERVENTARLAKTYSQLVFDMPRDVALSWYGLVQIYNAEGYFNEHYETKTEKNVMDMLLSDVNNPASLLSSLKYARENLRTTRDSLPKEAWRHINELYLLVKENQEDFKTRGLRNALLEQIIHRCQAWTGMLSSTMSHNTTYHFMLLGRSLERAEMTSRILDVAGLFEAQQSTTEEETPYQNILWSHLLRMLSAYFMYRQNVQTEINGAQVIAFLTQDTAFARSIGFNLNVLKSVVSQLPTSKAPLLAIETLVTALHKQENYEVGSTQLHEFIDNVQLNIAQIHGLFDDIWFNPVKLAK